MTKAEQIKEIADKSKQSAQMLEDDVREFSKLFNSPAGITLYFETTLRLIGDVRKQLESLRTLYAEYHEKE